jgi:hypothetical protein
MATEIRKHLPRICLLSLLLMSSCATAPELPTAAKPIVICLYKALRSKPEIVAVDVYINKYGPVISYKFHDRSGDLIATDLSVNEPDGAGRASYSGDFMTPENPLLGMEEEIRSKCRAHGNWTDQVIITGPDNDPYRWRVDMSRYEK